MSKKHEITVYTFDELSPKAKEKARDWWRTADDGDISWAEFTTEDATTIADGLGFSGDVKIYWSLGYSQSDYAAIIGQWDASKFNKKALKDYKNSKELKPLIAEWAAYVKKYPLAAATVKYHHYYGSQFDFELGEDLSYDDPRDIAAESELKELLRDFNRYIYKSIRDEHEYRNSDEQIDETLRANEYEFYENGEKY